MTFAPPGWYPNPDGSPDQRWWDGHQWQPQTRPGPTRADPGRVRALTFWKWWAIGALPVAAVAVGLFCVVGLFVAAFNDSGLPWAQVVVIPVDVLCAGLIFAVALGIVVASVQAQGRAALREAPARTIVPAALLIPLVLVPAVLAGVASHRSKQEHHGTAAGVAHAGTAVRGTACEDPSWCVRTGVVREGG